MQKLKRYKGQSYQVLRCCTVIFEAKLSPPFGTLSEKWGEIATAHYLAEQARDPHYERVGRQIHTNSPLIASDVIIFRRVLVRVGSHMAHWQCSDSPPNAGAVE